jgi:hypothetical protein
MTDEEMQQSWKQIQVLNEEMRSASVWSVAQGRLADPEQERKVAHAQLVCQAERVQDSRPGRICQQENVEATLSASRCPMIRPSSGATCSGCGHSTSQRRARHHPAVRSGRPTGCDRRDTQGSIEPGKVRSSQGEFPSSRSSQPCRSAPLEEVDPLPQVVGEPNISDESEAG